MSDCRFKIKVEVLKMSILKFSKQSKFQKFISSKGFYIALALCLIGSGISAWISVDRTINGLQQIGTSSISSAASSTSSESSAPVEDVNEQAIDVPISSIATSSEIEAQQTANQDQLFIMPVSGDVINPFSNNELVKSKTLNDWRTHDGIDIACESGTQVKAACAGTVTKIYDDAMWGKCIEIEHQNKIKTYYYSLSDSVSVTVGQKVETGTVIGTVSDSASAEVLDAMHLHFGVKKDGVWVDPLSIVTTQ